MSLFDELSTLTKAGAKAAPAPAPAPVAAVPVVAPNESPAVAVAAAAAPAPAASSTEPTVVPFVPDVSAPVPTKLFDASGALRGTLTSDGKFVAVNVEGEDPLAGLSVADRAPVDPETESRVDLPQRSGGRIKFLTATYESAQEDPAYPERREKRLKNDLHRALFARPRNEFDPENTPAAESIKKWIQ